MRTETPEEVVVPGAHYDHLGHDCDSDDPDDVVCNGASDNASGVAAVLEISRRLAEDPPSRSVVLALWDAEEDDRLGSMAAVESGVLDIDSVVAYLNWDMQGTNLLLSLADTTFVIGAETAGPALEDAVATGVGSTDLLPVDLSLLFGQGRSDHASFVDAGVPSVFLSDATSACYHTAPDDLEHLDLDKLARRAGHPVRRDDLDRYLESVRIEPGSLDHLCGSTSTEPPGRSRRLPARAGHSSTDGDPWPSVRCPPGTPDPAPGAGPDARASARRTSAASRPVRRATVSRLAARLASASWRLAIGPGAPAMSRST
jgi:Zn-dependent M28 family amino/carboxypeptidase